MLLLASAILGAIGFVSMVTRRSLLGLSTGIQLVLLGATMMFVFAGQRSGAGVDGQIAAIMVCLSAIVPSTPW